ncbi:hypothetical protein HA482_32435 [Bradyrhizobium sp. INPA_01384B]|uniref:DUF2382 domain-containing protein n=1 Tax=Bradyrhizobium campsiandrae TaxID=1729892 RepID=A0ABR7UHG4_9BRAD|nr:hypothetical protein [Bradyrhizobium campsiandrae]
MPRRNEGIGEQAHEQVHSIGGRLLRGGRQLAGGRRQAGGIEGGERERDAAVAVEVTGQRVGDVLLVNVERPVRRREQHVDVQERVVAVSRRLKVRHIGDDGGIEGADESPLRIDDDKLPLPARKAHPPPPPSVAVPVTLVRLALAGETRIM